MDNTAPLAQCLENSAKCFAFCAAFLREEKERLVEVHHDIHRLQAKLVQEPDNPVLLAKLTRAYERLSQVHHDLWEISQMMERSAIELQKLGSG